MNKFRACGVLLLAVSVLQTASASGLLRHSAGLMDSSGRAQSAESVRFPRITEQPHITHLPQMFYYLIATCPRIRILNVALKLLTDAKRVKHQRKSFAKGYKTCNHFMYTILKQVEMTNSTVT